MRLAACLTVLANVTPEKFEDLREHGQEDRCS